MGKGFLQQLEITDRQRGMIEHAIMYAIFNVYISTAPGSPVDTSQVVTILLTRFRGKQLIAAAYIFGSIELEVKTGENFDLLDDLRIFAFKTYKTEHITAEQFDNICQLVASYYRKTGRSHNNSNAKEAPLA